MTTTSTGYAGRTKYTRERARKYQQRPPAKHQAEMRLLDRAFALIPQEHRVLDAPCGGGRVSVHFARRGYAMTAADLSPAMIEVARETMKRNALDVPVLQQDIERLTFPDCAFDTVVSFRLFHHFPTVEIRRRVVHSLCRVAVKTVVLSYFAPSLSAVRRKLRERRSGSKKYITPLKEVAGYFHEAGFRLVKDFAQTPLIHTLHVAVFERSGDAR
ncbi:MAG TPA: class I SAM-dependent methyltransferase [Verrucomicrobiae bacterium]|nr:class I SAM-dependent methyltransferase [Verrucomicrobiae bacterium]